MKDIPVHRLQDRGSSGLEIKHFLAGETSYKSVETLGAHRDDHYLFFVLEDGHASLMIDFHEVPISKSNLYYILPGQVHHRIKNEVAQGWFLAIDTILVPKEYRDVFEDRLLLQQPYILNPVQLQQCQVLLQLIEEKRYENQEAAFYFPVLHSLLQTFVGVAAGCYSECGNANFNLSRPAQLAREFKNLLPVNILTMKSPSAYAEMLNVSESYLNEALKKVTGFSVSYWILQEVMLEAKRLLYYSDLTVKEIAHRLGYEDNTYFSRIFKKALDVTPLEFREHYRK